MVQMVTAARCYQRRPQTKFQLGGGSLGRGEERATASLPQPRTSVPLVLDRLRLPLQRRLTARVVEVLHSRWDGVAVAASIHGGTARSARFDAFGPGSLLCFPWSALYNEGSIRIGADTMIGPWVSLTAGMVPGQAMVHDAVVCIGDRCVIGRGNSIVGHFSIDIGDDVYTGPNVYITDQNHGLSDVELPIGRQWPSPEAPVRIGSGSWLGTGVVVLPGVTIGRGVAVGAGSVVTGDLPDYAVAVGAPARVVRLRTG